MGQEFHVVRCFSCQSFQVQQVKKVNRWSCKLCGEKQSLLKEFGRGSGADCRRHVQKLNAMRGAMLEEQERHTWSLWQQVETDAEDEPGGQRDDQVTHHQVSCWSKYLDTPEEAEPEEEEENVLMDRQLLYGNNTIDRKRKRREVSTDRQEQDRWTPAQSNWVTPSTTTTSLTNTSPPSKKSLNRPSLTNTSPPSKKSLNRPNLTNTSPPSKKSFNRPSLTNTSPPSKSFNRPSLTNTSPPSKSFNRPSLTNTSPPSKKSFNRPSLTNTSPPSKKSFNRPSLTNTSPPSKKSFNRPGLTNTSPPSKSFNRPSLNTGVVSRWARFLSSDCPVTEEGEEPSVSGRGQVVDGASPLPSNDVNSLAPPPTRPHPLLPVFSMFQSEDDFNFSDEDFLIKT